MATPAASVLSDSNMSQLERQIQAIETFRGDHNALYTFISRIDFVLTLYPTTDVRQQYIIFGHIERNISGEVMRTINADNMTTWPELKKQLIISYKPQVPNHQLLEDFRNTQFKGNVRSFLEEAEAKRQLLASKLSLENNVSETALFNRLINSSIEALIQKLPTNTYLRIVNCNIPDLRSLINLLQEKGLYEDPVQKTQSKVVTDEKQNKPRFDNRNNVTNNSYNRNTPFQPYFNPIMMQPNYQGPYRPPMPNYPYPNYQPHLNNMPRPTPPIPYMPRPNVHVQRQNAFDLNRFGQYQTQQQQQQQAQQLPNANPFTNNNPTKRMRPTDSGQTKMSIEETRNQEEESNLPYDPYNFYYNPNFYQYPAYYPADYPEQYNQQYLNYQDPQILITGEQNEEEKSDIAIGQAENFQPPASELTST